MKDPIDWLYIFPTVKARKNVGRRAKPAVRPRKFATRKNTCFVNKMILGSETSNKFFISKNLILLILFQSDHWMKFIDDGCYHTLVTHCVMEVCEYIYIYIYIYIYMCVCVCVRARARI